MLHTRSRMGALRERAHTTGGFPEDAALPSVMSASVAPALAIDASCVPAYALEALSVMLDAGREAFLVGGFVRDALRGAPAHDVDITTDALWYQTRDIFMARGYRVVETGVQHGTVTVVVDGRPVEITTFRTDGAYSDHRRPDSVRFVRDVEDDLARRDFTINAMAWNPVRGLVDPFGGREDLAAGVVRAVGEPDERFREDALRVMRGVRFASKLDFGVEERTAEAIHARRRDLSFVARERVAAEYDGIVRGVGAVGALRAFPDVAFAAIKPIRYMVGFDQRSKWHCYDVWEHCLHALEALPPEAPPLVRHTTLLHDIGKPSTFTVDSEGRGHFYGHEEEGARILREALGKLRWRRMDIEHVCCLVRMHDRHIVPTPRGIRRALASMAASFPGAEDMACDMMRELFLVKRADTAAHAPSCVGRRMREIDRVEEAFEAEMADRLAFRVRDLAVRGEDVLAAGFAPGPEVGRVLKRLLSSVIEGDVPNERAALMAELERLRS